jgi:HSP20 family protein
MGEALPPRPFFPVFPVEEEVRRLFQELIHQPWGGRGFSEISRWHPRVDMCETPEAIIVEVELPGMQREDVRIELEGDVLHITGERRTTAERQERNYYRLERSYGRFERQLRLPGSVAREAIRTEFDAGILIITLPKRERR